MGGLPFWLMSVNPLVKLRTSEKSYMTSVENWFSVLMSKIRPHLYVNGGPIITVQVENEYGSYTPCDRDYTSWLRDLIRHHLGNDVVLFSTDGDGDGYLQCGKIPGVYATVDFGSGQAHGYSILYCTQLEEHFPDPALLEMKGLDDRAYIYIDTEFIEVLSRSGSLFSLPVQAANNQKLCALVENQ